MADKSNPAPSSQTLPGSCVAACAEMLTGGARTEAQVLREAVEWVDVDKIAGVLGPEWKGGILANPADAFLIAKQGQMGGLLHAPGTGPFHMVVIEPLPKAFLVRDPLPGVTYTVDEDWISLWVEGAFYK
jgi:hypothetical protein